MVLIPNFVLDNNYVYVAKGVSPRTASLSSVSISYDNLADLVYYCNEHGLSTSLVYNSAVDAYVGWVNDSAINITGFSYTTLNGLLGNNAGKVYVAQDSNSAGTGDINSPSHWMSFPSISPVISPVSYDALCRIVLDLNAVQQPAEITTYSYGNTTYYVVISDGGRSAGKYYCSLDGRIYAIPTDKADISLTIQVWCYQIKNKRNSQIPCSGTKTYREYKPVYQDRDHRLDKRPHNSQIRTCISCFEIILCKLCNKPSVLINIHR